MGNKWQKLCGQWTKFVEESDPKELKFIHLLLLSDDNPKPGHQDLFYHILSGHRKLKEGQDWGGFGIRSLAGEQIVTTVHKDFPGLQQSGFPVDQTN